MRVERLHLSEEGESAQPAGKLQVEQEEIDGLTLHDGLRFRPSASADALRNPYSPRCRNMPCGRARRHRPRARETPPPDRPSQHVARERGPDPPSRPQSTPLTDRAWRRCRTQDGKSRGEIPLTVAPNGPRSLNDIDTFPSAAPATGVQHPHDPGPRIYLGPLRDSRCGTALPREHCSACGGIRRAREERVNVG